MIHKMARPQQQPSEKVDSVAIARELVLERSGLTLSSLDRAMASAMSRDLDYADLYFQMTRFETWTVEDGIVKEGVYSIDQGIGVRAVTGEKTGFAYADQLDEPSLLDAVAAARGIARTQGSGNLKVMTRAAAPSELLYPVVDPLVSMADRDKVQLLADIDRRVRAMDSRITQVVASLAAVYEVMLVQGSDGTLAADVRPLVRFNVSVIMEHEGRREQGYAGGGGRGDFAVVTADDRPLAIAREAVRQAAVNLEAVPRRRATCPSCSAPGWPGILLHEAIGHGLEGDFNRKGTSAFSRTHRPAGRDRAVHRRRRRHAARRRGSLNVDDEGTPTQCTMLIENGVLQRLHAGQAQRAAHGDALHRQRPPRVIRARADAAHDEHVHAAGHVRSGRDHRLGGQGPLRAELRRRSGRHHAAASSCSPRARRT